MYLFRNRVVVDGIRLEGAAARRLMEEALRQASMERRSGVGLRELLLTLAFFAIAIPCGVFLPRLSDWMPLFPAYLIPIVIGIVVPMLLGVWWRWTHKHAIRRAMLAAGYLLCENCGYWLRGLGDDVKQCPECGEARSTEGSQDIGVS